MHRRPRKKPRFAQSQGNCLITSTLLYERFNLNFKAPLASTTKHHYFLTVIDEFPRFPVALSCPDMTSLTIINCLIQWFYNFGTCGFLTPMIGHHFNLLNLNYGCFHKA